MKTDKWNDTPLRCYQGMPVRICFAGDEIDGEVLMNSPNCKSLMLRFHGMLGGYIGMLAALYDGHSKTYRDLITNRRVEVRRRA